MKLNLTKKKNPRRYHAGILLNKVVVDFEAYSPKRLAPNQLQLILPNDASNVVVDVKEKVKSLFLAHITSCIFVCKGTISSTENCHFSLSFNGFWKKLSPNYQTKNHNKLSELFINGLNSHPEIGEELLGLDFQYCALTIENGHWHLEIEPFVASEIICQFPPTRRYLRMPPSQRIRLLSLFLMINQLTLNINNEIKKGINV